MYPSRPSRWCPTPEQLMILEEMYRGGLRTPKSAQIQAITAHLSHYGNIESKNVFYWFQNHKARDRQKLRKKLMMSSKKNPNQQNVPHHHFATHPQLFYYVPVQILPQVGSTNASPQTMTYSVKQDPVRDQICETKDPAIKMDGSDWVVMLDGILTNKSLKTLELFPTTPSCGPKNECIASSECASSTSSDKP